jgi:hypothetical protein
VNLVGKLTEEVRKKAQKKGDEEDKGRNPETAQDRSVNLVGKLTEEVMKKLPFWIILVF